MAVSDSQWHPWYLYLIKKVDNIVGFLGLKVVLLIPIRFPAVEMRKLILQSNLSEKWKVYKIINIDI